MSGINRIFHFQIHAELHQDYKNFLHLLKSLHLFQRFLEW